MGEHRAVLRRVGWVLIVIGLIDIGVMAWCIATRRNYSSSFNVFAVIAGVLLLRGSLATARLVTVFSAFFLACFASLPLVLPALQPAALWVAEARVNPLGSAMSLLVSVLMIAVLIWVYRQLRSAPVLAALQASGRKTSVPRWAFAGGVALVVVLAVALRLMMGGEAGAKAVALAKAQYGDGYQYWPTQMHLAGDHGSATVAAWNDHDVRRVDVEW
jgi:hypothetical protein